MEYRIAKERAWLDQMEIGAMDAAEMEEVLDVVSRGMRDNPQHVAAFGEDPEIRRRRFRALMAAAFSASDFSHALVARREDGVIVGCMRHVATRRLPAGSQTGVASPARPALHRSAVHGTPHALDGRLEAPRPRGAPLAPRPARGERTLAG